VGTPSGLMISGLGAKSQGAGIKSVTDGEGHGTSRSPSTLRHGQVVVVKDVVDMVFTSLGQNSSLSGQQSSVHPLSQKHPFTPDRPSRHHP
jgi:hypothetical protein